MKQFSQVRLFPASGESGGSFSLLTTSMAGVRASGFFLICDLVGGKGGGMGAGCGRGIGGWIGGFPPDMGKGTGRRLCGDSNANRALLGGVPDGGAGKARRVGRGVLGMGGNSSN